MIFGAVSNAAYRLSLRDRGAEIEGGSQESPPPSENLEAHQGAGQMFNTNPCLVLITLGRSYAVWPKVYV